MNFPRCLPVQLRIGRLLLLAVIGGMFCLDQASVVQAEDTTVSFGEHIFPILRKSCFECHGAEEQEGGLRLDERNALFDSGSVVAGKPDESELLRRVMLPKGHSEIMPAVGDPLAPKEVAIVRAWIEQGANWPEDFIPPPHWAYVKPTRPATPTVTDPAWIRSPIDAFVLRRLEQEGLAPSPIASPEKRIRRVYFDLIGLPPTPEEVNAFVADPSDQHYAQIVDQLLKQPQFGERWARPWLDLARYADSHGFQRDDFRDIWPYRDWVIRAMNDDMSFDQFTIEQIAGDLLPDATESQRIATGFHRCAPTNCEAGSLPEETRAEQIIDRVNTTGAVWLGTTLECCQCHDHKYDPFSARDYYQLLAFFNSTEREADLTDPKTPSSIQFQGPSMSLANPERAAKHDALTKQRAAIDEKQQARRKELNASLVEWIADSKNMDAKTTPKAVKAAAKKPAEKWTKKEKTTLLDFYAKQDQPSQKLQKQLNQFDKQLKETEPDTTLVMIELNEPRPTHIYLRGDYKSKGDRVEPGTPERLHAMPQGPPNRLTLANWLISPENPLVARVVVNRWWAQLFGQGLVTTEEDFGIKGEPPTHPELLDWLAVEFMDNGWSRKKLLREIVLSSTYQQSSRITPQLQQIDDQNKLLARGPRFRMSAEMVRDNALATSGLLSEQQFGPPIRPYQPPGIWTKVGGQRYKYEVSPGSEKHRRGIYVVLKRGSPYPSFLNFDGTARLACTVERSRTNTPLQALTLLNDPVYVEAAKSLATRIREEQSDVPLDDQLTYAFQLCTARQPNEVELATIKQLYESQFQAERADDDSLNLEDAKEAAWYSVATALLNLHETITKD